jgi:hypothetical protein
VIILTPAGLVMITAVPGMAESPWCLVRANRAMDLALAMPGAPVTDTGSPEGWRFAAIAPRAMVAEGLARCVESAAYPHLSGAVPVQDQQLAELAQGLIDIAAEMPWQPPGEAPPAAPDQPPDDPSPGADQQQPSHQTFDDAPPSASPQSVTTYDGPAPVTTNEDPFDALIPAQPTLCQLQADD